MVDMTQSMLSKFRSMMILLLAATTLTLAGCEPVVEAFDFTNPDAIVIDVRTLDEWNGAHLETAVRIDWQNIRQGVASMKLNKDQPIFIYCQSGNRAGKAEKMLLDQGYTAVYNLGGLQDAMRLTGVRAVR